jgi:hypothetical protein
MRAAELIPALMALSFVAGCDDFPGDPGSGPADAPDAFAPGKADGVSDAADCECRVKLRSLAQPFGLPTNTFAGRNWVVWSGVVDVASGEFEGGQPSVMYWSQWLPDGQWSTVPAVPIDGGPPGFDRYEFTLDVFTVPGGDNIAWRDLSIEVIPFVETADGSRFFDHNRHSGPFDNYVLNADASTINDDGECATPSDGRCEPSECGDIGVIDDVSAPWIGGHLAHAECPRNPNATVPWGCFAVIEQPDDARIGLLWTDSPVGAVEQTLECLAGQEVAIMTNGVLTEGDAAFLQTLLMERGQAEVSTTLRWGGEIAQSGAL